MSDLLEKRMLINGSFTTAVEGGWIDVENPSRGTILGRVPAGTAADVDRAVDAAKVAFSSWRRLPARTRGEMLWRIGDAIDARREEIAQLIASETGNALRTQARGEATSAGDVFRYFGGAAAEQKGETLPLGSGLLSYTLREPIGVVGAIVAWNAPFILSTMKITAALATGNTMVLKSAEDAPLAVAVLAEICNEYLPAGVLNVITGTGAAVGAPLAAHPDVHKLSFTGSTAVGREIMKVGSNRLVSAALELGGKNPAIVFPDSDTDAVADGVIMGMRFTRQGQSCTAGSRLYVHGDIRESFMNRITTKLEKIVIGDALDEATDMGAIVSSRQFSRVTGYIREGLEQGGSLLTGGLPDSSNPGYFIAPTVFEGVANDWRIAKEEIFGPVLVAIPWTDLDTVIGQANDSHYGLAGYVWSKDIDQAITTAHSLEAGWIQINRGGGQIPGMSYGGIRQSGIGREYSIEGALEDYTERKSFTIGLSA